MKKILSLVLITLTTYCYGFNEKNGISAKIIKVIDGNTVEILTEDDEVFKVMLADVDSPELGQEYGEDAKHFTEKLLLKKRVTVEMKGKDMWGNRLVRIVLKNGKNVDLELLEAGFAWHNSIKSKDATLAKLQQETMEKKMGLWASEDPTPPWIYRRQQTMTTAKSR